MLTAGGVRILCHVAAIQKGAKYDKYRIPICMYLESVLKMNFIHALSDHLSNVFIFRADKL